MTDKILIVDDEPFNLDLLEQELADRGYAVERARNGAEALQKNDALPTPIITPTACPDGNDVDGATTNALDGRGRSAAYLAISVISPLRSTVITRNSAARRLRRCSATTITTSARSRNAVGPKTVQNTSQNLTQRGLTAP